MAFLQHAGMVIVCDGTEATTRRLGRVLWSDPAMGVMRHADVGYEEAIACAREHGLRLLGLFWGVASPNPPSARRAEQAVGAEWWGRSTHPCYALEGRVAENSRVTEQLHKVIDGVCEAA